MFTNRSEWKGQAQDGRKRQNDLSIRDRDNVSRYISIRLLASGATSATVTAEITAAVHHGSEPIKEDGLIATTASTRLSWTAVNNAASAPLDVPTGTIRSHPCCTSLVIAAVKVSQIPGTWPTPPNQRKASREQLRAGDVDPAARSGQDEDTHAILAERTRHGHHCLHDWTQRQPNTGPSLVTIPKIPTARDGWA
jgi:hypothetical protein